MISTVWALAAVAAGLLMAVLVGRSVPWRSQPADAGAPGTALQKRARLSLILGGLLALGFVALLAAGGPDGYWGNAAVRIPAMLLMLLVLSSQVFLTLERRRGRDGREVLFDERDREILSRAPATQLAGVLTTLAVWVVVLTETYWDRGQVPLAFPVLIFWSALLVSALSLPLGVLLGYRRG